MTPDQRMLARAALGLPNEAQRSYRNRYFAAAGTDFEERWDDLAQGGMAAREKGRGRLSHFYLTDAGAKAALDPGESLDQEDFPDVVGKSGS